MKLSRHVVFAAFMATVLSTAYAADQLFPRRARPQASVAVPIDQTNDLQSRLDTDSPIPPGTYRFAGQLTLRRGWSSPGVRLEYTGPPRADGCVKIAAGSWNQDIGRVWLENLGERGKGVGIGSGTDTTAPAQGTQSGVAVWSGVTVSGFGIGVKFGDEEGRSSSEIEATSLHTQHCDIGVYVTAWNTCSINIRGFGAYDNRVGLQVAQGGPVNVTGGSVSRVRETVFQFGPGGQFGICGVRAEHCGLFLKQAGEYATARNVVNMTLCSSESPTGDTDVLVWTGGTLSAKDCTFHGKIQYQSPAWFDPPDGWGGVSLENCWTYGPTLIDGNAGSKGRWSARGCGLLDEKGQVKRRVDGTGVIGDGRVPK